MAAHQRRTLSVSAVKHPSAHVPAALNHDAMSNTNNIVLDHIVELFLPTQCGVCREPLPEDISAVSKRISDEKKRSPTSDTTAFEREIDGLVYALYGLTPEEIKIVEEARA